MQELTKEPPTELMNQFHKLWTRDVHTPGYNKSEWQKLESMLYRQYAPTTGALTDDLEACVCADVNDLLDKSGIMQHDAPQSKWNKLVADLGHLIFSRRTAEPQPAENGPCSVCGDGGVEFCKLHGSNKWKTIRHHSDLAAEPQPAAFKMVILNDGEDGFTVAEFPSMPGYISQGKTESDALRNLADAIDAVKSVTQPAVEPSPAPNTYQVFADSITDPSGADYDSALVDEPSPSLKEEVMGMRSRLQHLPALDVNDLREPSPAEALTDEVEELHGAKYHTVIRTAEPQPKPKEPLPYPKAVWASSKGWHIYNKDSRLVGVTKSDELAALAVSRLRAELFVERGVEPLKPQQAAAQSGREGK